MPWSAHCSARSRSALHIRLREKQDKKQAPACSLLRCAQSRLADFRMYASAALAFPKPICPDVPMWLGGPSLEVTAALQCSRVEQAQGPHPCVAVVVHEPEIHVSPPWRVAPPMPACLCLRSSRSRGAMRGLPRDISVNKLSGTVPAQLSSLRNLKAMCAAPYGAVCSAPGGSPTPVVPQIVPYSAPIVPASGGRVRAFRALRHPGNGERACVQ
jgi:hypothetical protein